MYVTRCNNKEILKSLDSPYVTALLGPRRVGKTTLVQQLALEPGPFAQPQKKWVFLNMDARAERLRVEADQLDALIEERARQKIGASPLWIVIDEAQKCPALFEQIKLLYDRYKDQSLLKFILTGSGFLTLHQLSAETLAGRIELHQLREFTLRETTALKTGSAVPHKIQIFDHLIDPSGLSSLKNSIEALAPFREELQRSLRELLVWGGLPEVLSFDAEQEAEKKISYLANYLQTYLEKDVRDIGTVADLPLYQKMMEIVAQQTGSVREDKRIVDALGCSRDTLKKYRGFLEATLVYRELYPYIGSPLKRLVKSPKGFLTNNGLISYLTGIYDLALLEKSALIGHRFENWALREFQTWLDRDPRRSELFFWRTSGQVEVDLVIEKNPHVLPCEVTYGSRVDPKKVKHLKQFLQQEPRAHCGIYLYQGEFSYDPDARIIFLPAWTLG